MSFKSMQDQGYFKDPSYPTLWFAVPRPQVGERIKRISQHSSTYSKVKKGAVVSVLGIYDIKPTGKWVYDERDNYLEVYSYKIKVSGSSQIYDYAGFEKVNIMPSIYSIEQDRPTFIREFKEVTVDGKLTREYIGEFIPFNNLSAAKNYCTNSITESIRTNNVYRRFTILIENSVAQAKKPEIDFV